MKKYIGLDDLVAEIEKRIKEHEEEEKKGWAYSRVKIVECEHILSNINSLEVKEVDLEKEYECYMNEEISEKEWIREDYLDFAKHFFELGLKAEKDLELSWEDIKTIDKLLNQCVDYSNPYQEVLKRFKAQKGE